MCNNPTLLKLPNLHKNKYQSQINEKTAQAVSTDGQVAHVGFRRIKL